MQDRFKFRTWHKGYQRFFGAGFDDSGYTFYNGVHKVDHYKEFEETEQCTGMKDKNGTLIYEGDIVTHSTHPEGYVVKWEQELYAFDLGLTNYVTDQEFGCNITEVEIIGHKHIQKPKEHNYYQKTMLELEIEHRNKMLRLKARFWDKEYDRLMKERSK